MTDFRRQWNNTCRAAGLTSIGKDTAARLLAIVYKFDHELITHNTKLRADLDYIQDEYGIRDGLTPDKDFCVKFARYVLDIEKNGDNPTEWAKKLMKDNYCITL